MAVWMSGGGDLVLESSASRDELKWVPGTGRAEAAFTLIGISAGKGVNWLGSSPIYGTADTRQSGPRVGTYPT
jgi:hypothetical protein